MSCQEMAKWASTKHEEAAVRRCVRAHEPEKQPTCTSTTDKSKRLERRALLNLLGQQCRRRSPRAPVRHPQYALIRGSVFAETTCQ